ncbi:MAG: RNA methyltransferase, partial [Bacteroidales bacterium]|nr:RNA methyltransferase [Bacteroidales bacterium]
MRIETITSVQNPKIKDLLSLQEKSRLRRQKGLFVVEGRREFLHCLEAGFIPSCLFICGEIFSPDEMQRIVSLSEKANPKVGIIQVSSYIYDKIAYRGGTEGIIAEVNSVDRTLEDLVLS